MVSYFFLTFDSFIITLCNINITFDCNFVTYLHALVNKLVFIHLSPRISVSNILKDCAQSKIYILMHYKNENIQSVLVVLSYSYWTKMCKYYKNNTRLTNIYIYIYIYIWWSSTTSNACRNLWKIITLHTKMNWCA